MTHTPETQKSPRDALVHSQRIAQNADGAR